MSTTKKKNFFGNTSTEIVTQLVDTINLDTAFGTAPQFYIGMDVSPDGKYISHNIYAGLERFSQLILTTPNDFSAYTVSHAAKWNNQPRGLAFTSNGLRMFNCQLALTQQTRTLGTAWNMNTGGAITTNSYIFAQANNYFTGLVILDDGSALIAATEDNYPATFNCLAVMEMSTPFDVTTITTHTPVQFDVFTGVLLYGNIRSFIFVNNGNSIIIMSWTGWLFKYDLTVAYDITTRINSFVKSGQLPFTSDCMDIGITSDESYIYVVEGGAANDLHQLTINH